MIDRHAGRARHGVDVRRIPRREAALTMALTAQVPVRAALQARVGVALFRDAPRGDVRPGAGLGVVDEPD